jgi:hypothetical protein
MIRDGILGMVIGVLNDMANAMPSIADYFLQLVIRVKGK